MAVPESAVVEGAVSHPDPDVLVSYKHGFHDYGSIEEASDAVVNDELSLLAFEFVLEDLVE